MPIPVVTRPRTGATIAPPPPRGAIVPYSRGGALVRTTAGGLVPWVQRIATGIVPGGAATLAPLAGLATGLSIGGATLASSGRPGTAKMSLLGGDASSRSVTGKNNRYAYPAGPAFGGDQQNFPNGRGKVGGGNAGASIQPPARRNPAPPPPPPPGSSNVAIVNPPSRARNAALSRAAQQAGLPAWNWQAEENAAMLRAAQEAGQAAQAARAAQGGRGYLSAPAAGGQWNAPTTSEAILMAQGAGALDGLKPGATSSDAILAGQSAGVFDRGIGAPRAAAGGLPATSNPATQAYWERADISAWAAANPTLAAQLKQRSGFAGSAPAATPRPAAGMDWASEAGQSVREFQRQEAMAAGMGFADRSGLPAGAGTGFAAPGAVAGQVAPQAVDPTRRVAMAQASAPSMAAEDGDPAQELNRRYLREIRLHGMGLG